MFTERKGDELIRSKEKITIPNQQEIVYSEVGDKENDLVVFLHGWRGTRETWTPNLNFVAKAGFWAVAPDLPGFGDSPLPKKAWGTKDYAEATKEFIESVGKKKAFVIGRSFGARIAIRMASEYPKLVDKLVLISAAGIERKTPKVRLIGKAAKLGKKIFKLPLLKEFEEEARGLIYTIAGTKDYLEAGEKKEILAKVVGEDLSGYLKKIKVPTLIIWGEKDEITPLWMGKSLNEKIRNSKLVVIKDAAHQVHKEKPEEVNLHITQFLKKS